MFVHLFNVLIIVYKHIGFFITLNLVNDKNYRSKNQLIALLSLFLQFLAPVHNLYKRKAFCKRKNKFGIYCKNKSRKVF